TRRHARLHGPQQLALFEAVRLDVALADHQRLVVEDASEVQVVRGALLLPDAAAVAEVDAVNAAGVRRREDDLAVHDHRWADLPLGVDVGVVPAAVRPRLEAGRRSAAAGPVTAVPHFFAVGVVLVAVRVGPDEAVGQQIDAEDGAGVRRA